MKRYVYLTRCKDAAECIAFEVEADAQELVDAGSYRGPFKVEFRPNKPQQLSDAVDVEQPEAGGSVRV